jgi:dihydroorotase
MLVTPGLVDIHVHLREPGQEYKETIETGTRAAASGGFTSVCCMANTDPVNDNASVTDYIIKQASKCSYARVFPIGAVTLGLKGEILAELGELTDAGCVAFSDDGQPIMNSAVMRRALEYLKRFNRVLIVHAEDKNLSSGGVMHEGEVSTELGLPGIPASAEEVMVARDICLAKAFDARVHFAHISTAGSVELIRRAKKEGVPVTAETAPHYFSLSAEAVRGYNTSAKVNPPLRTEEDVVAIKEGLADGTIDCIASDHAPHASHEKNIEFQLALCGISGLETTLGLTLKLVEEGTLSMRDAIAKLTTNPAKVLGLQIGTLSRGMPADLTIIDPEEEWVVEPQKFLSKGKHSPFEGMKLKGKVRATMIGGKLVKF